MPRRLLCVGLTWLVALLFLYPTRPLRAEETAPLALLVFNRPPYYILHDGKAAGGFLLTAALDVFNRAGIPVALQEMPPGRISATLPGNPARLCAVGWIKTPEREALARFSLPLYHNQPVAVAVGKDRAKAMANGPPPTLDALLDLGLNWGLREGFSYGKVFDQAFARHPSNHVNRFSDTAHMVELVARGRLDAILIDPEELAWILAGRPDLRPRIRLAPLADAPAGAHRCIMCSPGVAPETMARLDAAIREFVASDRYRELTDFTAQP